VRTDTCMTLALSDRAKLWYLSARSDKSTRLS
jgi:hypothetical protein